MKLFHFRDISIRWKVVALMVALVAVGFLAAAAGLFAHMRSSFEHELINELAIIGDITASNVTAALDLNDGEAALEKLAILGRDERILTGAVYDQSGALFAAYRRPNNSIAPPAAAPQLPAPVFERDQLALVRPIERKGQAIGSVYVV